jgi:hypothetical protein
MTATITMKESPVTDSVSGPGDQHEDNAKDARVQVLTAEVRTLVVGSRQVTLSVYGQLDCMPHSQIEPFGRVRPKDADRSDIWVVGRHKADGSLIRSRAPHKSEMLNWDPFCKAAGKPPSRYSMQSPPQLTTRLKVAIHP